MSRLPCGHLPLDRGHDACVHGCVPGYPPVDFICSDQTHADLAARLATAERERDAAMAQLATAQAERDELAAPDPGWTCGHPHAVMAWDDTHLRECRWCNDLKKLEAQLAAVQADGARLREAAEYFRESACQCHVFVRGNVKCASCFLRDTLAAAPTLPSAVERLWRAAQANIEEAKRAIAIEDQRLQGRPHFVPFLHPVVAALAAACADPAFAWLSHGERS